TSSATSFSIIPFALAPPSWPPWPASKTINPSCSEPVAGTSTLLECSQMLFPLLSIFPRYHVFLPTFSVKLIWRDLSLNFFIDECTVFLLPPHAFEVALPVPLIFKVCDFFETPECLCVDKSFGFIQPNTPFVALGSVLNK